MSSSTPPTRVRIAIIGGGIVGMTLLHALSKHPHVKADLYEASTSLGDEGGANALTDAGAVPGISQLRIGKDPRSGAALHQNLKSQPTYTVARSDFLSKLAAVAPGDGVHLGMKLERVVENDDGTATSMFENGDISTVDAVIGSDGVRSMIRKLVLGPDHVAAEPVFTSTYTYISLIPMEEGKARIDCDVVDEAQVGWIGDGGFLLHDPSSNKQTLQIVAAIVSDKKEWAAEDWKREITPEQLRADLESWGELGQSLAECFLAKPPIRVFPMFQHLPAPTYTRASLCLVGDAAHAMQPWQGAGAGQGLEDALLLSAVLASIDASSSISIAVQVRAALRAFDTQRRPRAERVSNLSRGMGYLSTGRAPGIGIDIDKLEKALWGRWDYIWFVDLESKVKECTRLFREELWQVQQDGKCWEHAFQKIDR